MAMRPRHVGAPEVVPGDLEGGGTSKTVSMASVPGMPTIQPFEGYGNQAAGGEKKYHGRRSLSYSLDTEHLKQIGMIIGGIWLAGWFFLGLELLWPFYLVLNIFSMATSIPPFSWMFSWLYRGSPLVSHTSPVEELTLPTSQVSQHLDSYVQQFGDAALIFSTHDGYPQIVKGLLYNEDLGYRDLIDARDDAGNTALIYAASKGFRQCTAALLRNGADPDVSNLGGGGRTPLMEASGGGFKEIVTALRLTPNITVDLADDYGNTALHYAAYHGHLPVVLELLKSNPNKDVKNNYGFTPAAYATSNKHKAVGDMLNRQPRKSKRKEEASNLDPDLPIRKTPKEEKHVKGLAEDLHKTETDFEPKLENFKNIISDISSNDAKASQDGKGSSDVEAQVSEAKRALDEAELKAQKRIVELLEKNAEQQKTLDRAEHDRHAMRLNNTELSLKISELQSKHRMSELRAREEADRADSKHEEVKRLQAEADRHRSRAEIAERERDQHSETSHRFEENLQRLHDEVKSHQKRYEEQSHEASSLRDHLSRIDQERRQLQDELDALDREVREMHLTESG